MCPVNVLDDITTRQQFRDWLMVNHETEPEVWVSVKRGKPTDDAHLWYLDAVEEALCFGWIDAVLKKFPNGVTYQRWCPRRKNSRWSELNKERVRRLEHLGFMTDAGRACLPDMSEDSFQIADDIESALKSAGAWENFQVFPALYQRVRVNTLETTRTKPEVFRARLDKLVANTKQNKMFGDWNDYGRLLNWEAGTDAERTRIKA